MLIDYAAVGKRINRFRTIRKFSQEDLAFQVGTSTAYISSIEHGKKKPSLQKLYDIAEILGVTVNDFLYHIPIPQIDYSAGREFVELLSLCPPDRRQMLFESLTAIIKSFISN
jgi:transcriptional regulator with XRE-family HTH domain